MEKYKIISVGFKKVYEHRVIMEQFLNRKLSLNELVHHKDGNKRNNNIENLEIITRGEHASLHHKGKKYSKKLKLKMGKAIKEKHAVKKDAKLFSEKIKNGLKIKYPNGRIPWNKGIKQKDYKNGKFSSKVI